MSAFAPSHKSAILNFRFHFMLNINISHLTNVKCFKALYLNFTRYFRCDVVSLACLQHRQCVNAVFPEWVRVVIEISEVLMKCQRKVR